MVIIKTLNTPKLLVFITFLPIIDLPINVKYLVVQIKSCIFALSVQDIKTSAGTVEYTCGATVRLLTLRNSKQVAVKHEAQPIANGVGG